MARPTLHPALLRVGQAHLLAAVALLLAAPLGCGSSSGPVQSTSRCGDACLADAAPEAAAPAPPDLAPAAPETAPDPVPEAAAPDVPIDAGQIADAVDVAAPPLEAAAPDLAPDVVEARGPDGPVLPAGALVGFSVPGGTFNKAFMLQLLPAPGVKLTVTTDGTVPSDQSPAYQAPLLVDHTMQVRVLAVAPSGLERQVLTEVYLQIADDLTDFTSNLPLVFVHSLSAIEPAIDNYDYTPGALAITTPVSGTTRPLGSIDIASRMGFKVRGFTSRQGDQHSFAVELWDTVDGTDLKRSVLGLPAESDWVLYGPWDIDLSLIRNALAYALSNRVGRYAPRTRFVEVFLESQGHALSRASYRGVYTLIEKIKRDPMRVNIAHLKPADTTLPNLTGGYIFKVDDHLSPGEVPLMAGGRILEMVEPKSTALVTAQHDYLATYINDTLAALNGPGGTNPATGMHYSAYIDVDSWIDHHILSAFCKNADALRVSSFFSKDRGGKLVAGPLWDFDRSMGSNDSRIASPEGWNVSLGTQYFADPWWEGLFKDPAFTERYWKRWDELLATHLRSDVLTPLVFGLAAELSDAQQRHFRRWPQSQPAFGYLGEIYRLSSWLDARVTWTKSHLRTYTP